MTYSTPLQVAESNYENSNLPNWDGSLRKLGYLRLKFKLINILITKSAEELLIA